LGNFEFRVYFDFGNEMKEIENSILKKKRKACFTLNPTFFFIIL